MEKVMHSMKRSASMGKKDVYGGHTASFHPRLEDYAEIFGGLHSSSSRVSSIPVLDLPSSSYLDLDTRTPFRYDDVFDSNGDFAVTYDHLIQIMSACSNDRSEVNEDDDCDWNPSENRDPTVSHLDDEYLPFKVMNGNLNAEFVSNGFSNHKSFVTVSDVSLKTTPSGILPPNRPPPVVSEVRECSDASDDTDKFYDVEVDTRSFKGVETPENGNEEVGISGIEIVKDGDLESNEIGGRDIEEELQEYSLYKQETSSSEKDDIVFEITGNVVVQTHHTTDELASYRDCESQLKSRETVEELQEEEEAKKQREMEEERLRKMEEEREREIEREKDRATVFETRTNKEPQRSVKPGELESPQRLKARLERHRRIADRAAQALAEKNKRDTLAQREMAERNRFAEVLGAEVKRWSSGKEGNLRALISTLQYILGSDSGWQAVPLTEVITAAAVKKAYRKATLCVHPDKLQQRRATVQQRYVCEKVFDLLKESWSKFNSEEH